MFAVTVMFAVMIATLISVWRDANATARSMLVELEGIGAAFASGAAGSTESSDRNGVLRILRAMGRIPRLKLARVTDMAGVTVAELGYAVVVSRTFVSVPDLKDVSPFSLLWNDLVQVTVPVVKAGRPVGTLLLVSDTSDLKSQVYGNVLIILLTGLFALASGLVAGFVVQRSISQPISQLTALASNVRETQDFSNRLFLSSDDETGLLVDAFNEMLENIEERDRNLTRHRAQLEETVEQRTAELRVAKDHAEHANATKSEFLATISHEIRTPMNGMLVMAELLAASELPARHQRYADTIQNSGQVLLSLINDVLDFSKAEAGQMELESVSVVLDEVIENVLELFWERASSKGVDLSAVIAADVPSNLTSDPVRLTQILSNLVNNALKFTEHGHVLISVVWCPLSEVDDNSGTLRFCVQDTGVGIADDKVEVIFDSFTQADQSTTRNYGGTGLGLTISRKLTHAFGGRMWVESEEQKGSDFFFTIPTTFDAASVPRVHPGVLEKKRFLVVVAGTATRLAIVRYLRRLPGVVEVVEAADIRSSDMDRDTVIIADAVLIGSFRADVPPLAAADRPVVIAISELGDAHGESLMDQEAVNGILVRPLSRSRIAHLVDRAIQKGAERQQFESAHLRAAPAYPLFDGAHVLVADDNPVNREVILEVFRRLAITADTVANGADAVAAFKAGNYDFVFMDCSMPVMDGFEATRLIRRFERENGASAAPVVALTAVVAGTSLTDVLDAGMNDCLTKPYTIADIVRCLGKWLPDYCVDCDDAKAIVIEHDATDAQPIRAALDPTVIASIRELQQPGTDLLKRVSELYVSQAPAAMELIACAVGKGDYRSIAQAAHALKSLSANIGARYVADACDALEDQANRESDKGRDAALVRAQSALTNALVEIEDLIEDAAAAA